MKKWFKLYACKGRGAAMAETEIESTFPRT